MIAVYVHNWLESDSINRVISTVPGLDPILIPSNYAALSHGGVTDHETTLCTAPGYRRPGRASLKFTARCARIISVEKRLWIFF